MSSNLPYYVGFSYCLGIGPMRFKDLLETFGNVEKAYTAKYRELSNVIGPKIAEDFIRFRDTFKADSIIHILYNKDIHIITPNSSQYPNQLASISDPPICLYLKGDPNILTCSNSIYFAIVGTRKATSYGLHIAKTFSYDLTAHNFIIVSGMALGIDTAAHIGALDAQGKTIAVLGCGVDIVYPPTNKPLYDRILANGGAIISEFPPGHGVMKGLFVARNRIISALSRGVMIVEGEAQSGSLITARTAAMQGRDVFAPPVPLTSIMSQAPNILLKEGAILVTSIDDILQEYAIKKQTKQTKILPKQTDPLSQLIIEHIDTEPQNVDELTRMLHVPVTELLHTLSLLELQGIVAKNSEGKFSIAD